MYRRVLFIQFKMAGLLTNTRCTDAFWTSPQVMWNTEQSEPGPESSWFESSVHSLAVPPLRARVSVLVVFHAGGMSPQCSLLFLVLSQVLCDWGKLLKQLQSVLSLMLHLVMPYRVGCTSDAWDCHLHKLSEMPVLCASIYYVELTSLAPPGPIHLQSDIVYTPSNLLSFQKPTSCFAWWLTHFLKNAYRLST